MNKKKSNNLISLSTSNEIKNIWPDIAEMSLDAILKKLAEDQELLSELPIIKWVISANNIKNSIQQAAFLKKYSNFIGPIYLDNIGEKDTDLLSGEMFAEDVIDKVIENTIIYIDRYHNELKAKLLGKLFVETFKYHKFSVCEYNSLMFSIDTIHPFEGFEKLEEFYKYHIQMKNAETEDERRDIWDEGAKIEFQSLMTSGLLTLPSGGSQVGDLGGAFINKKGIKFYELVVKDII
ncbi:hypothetical protein [Photobacterium iliopiscarium]|uniref:DUF4393 domain-containing protein n=1 Tax=Photobacterium iliopiscarium TaxID=56192 RepID=A0A2T3MJ53_9GAMM|nr:hypothetical protein [Photobacterium iliopiscarium]PSV95226.1 hypothetical protein C9I88_13610 [Photobacterium iliopiscarium]